MAKVSAITNRVREFRELNNDMSQAELGKMIGVTRQTIIAIEQNRYSPSLESAFRIASVFNMNIESIFQWQDTNA